jgi:hypothetical protein
LKSSVIVFWGLDSMVSTAELDEVSTAELDEPDEVDLGVVDELTQAAVEAAMAVAASMAATAMIGRLLVETLIMICSCLDCCAESVT